MSGIETLHVSDEVQFGRDCEATQIPSGVRMLSSGHNRARWPNTRVMSRCRLSTLACTSSGRNSTRCSRRLPVAESTSASSIGEEKARRSRREKPLWER